VTQNTDTAAGAKLEVTDGAKVTKLESAADGVDGQTAAAR
jgi:hypothetical protein